MLFYTCMLKCFWKSDLKIVKRLLQVPVSHTRVVPQTVQMCCRSTQLTYGFPPRCGRAQWRVPLREAHWLRPESGNEWPQSEADHPGGETQPGVPGSGDQHLRCKPLPWPCRPCSVLRNHRQHRLHDASGPSAACGGPKNRGQWERHRAEPGAAAGGGEGLPPAGGVRAERRLCRWGGYGSLWPMLSGTRTLLTWFTTTLILY